MAARYSIGKARMSISRSAGVPKGPWSAAVAGAIVLCILTAIAFMHPSALGHSLGRAIQSAGPAMLLLGLLPLALTLVLFTLAVIDEPALIDWRVSLLSARTGVIIFIVSEVVFFASFFAVYFYFAAGPTYMGQGRWPPIGIQPVDPWGMPAVNTVVLLTSGVAVIVAHHAFLLAQRSAAQIALAIAIALGVLFLSIQVNEFFHAPFNYRDGAYASIFFIGTGFHGLHVFVGIVVLAISLLRLRAGHFTLKSHFGLEAPIWYWHFVDVIWLFLFVIFYW
jgi:heme/copper-type cytochrome/quinol oxidase subunit 3